MSFPVAPPPDDEEERMFRCPEFMAERNATGVLLTILLPPRSNHDFHVRLSQSLLAYVRRVQPAHVLVSFDLISFFNSEFISTLLRVRRDQETRGGDLRLCCLSPLHREVLQIVDPKRRLFPIFDSVAEAWQSCTA